MKSRDGLYAGFALSMSLGLLIAGVGARAAEGPDAASREADAAAAIDGLVEDEIFEAGMEGPSGGPSCALATPIYPAVTYVGKTTYARDWIVGIGPLPSPAHDAVYVFETGPIVSGAFTPIDANYDFAIFLIPSCSETGLEPAPLAATSTLGQGIDMVAAGLQSFHTYYLVISGIPSAGDTANGRVTFTTPESLSIISAP